MDKSSETPTNQVAQAVRAYGCCRCQNWCIHCGAQLLKDGSVREPGPAGVVEGGRGCPRCNNEGILPPPYEGQRCLDCGGTGEYGAHLTSNPVASPWLEDLAEKAEAAVKDSRGVMTSPRRVLALIKIAQLAKVADLTCQAPRQQWSKIRCEQCVNCKLVVALDALKATR